MKPLDPRITTDDDAKPSASGTHGPNGITGHTESPAAYAGFIRPSTVDEQSSDADDVVG